MKLTLCQVVFDVLSWHLPELLHLHDFSRHFLVGVLGPDCLGIPYVLEGAASQGPVCGNY